MDQNNRKGSQKRYHSLPFAVKVSVRRSFEQFRSLNWGDKEALRIIQSHHVIKHAVFKQSKGFLTACRNTAAYCIFLPFGTPDSGSKFRRYQVFIRYYWASAGMTKRSKLSKRKRNVLRREDCFFNFHQYSFQICITDQAWGGQYDWIYGQISFFFLFDLLKVLCFFLAGYATRLLRMLGRCATSLIEARFDCVLLWEVDL